MAAGHWSSSCRLRSQEIVGGPKKEGCVIDVPEAAVNYPVEVPLAAVGCGCNEGRGFLRLSCKNMVIDGR